MDPTKAFVLTINTKDEQFLIEIESNVHAEHVFDTKNPDFEGYFGCSSCRDVLSIKVVKVPLEKSEEKDVETILLPNKREETDFLETEEDFTTEEKAVINPLETSYKCIECGAILKSPDSFRLHKNIHTDKFRCNIKTCRKGFPNKTRLKLHLKSIHKIIEITVDDLNKVVSEPSTKNSRPKLPKNNKRPIICEICGRHYSSNVAYFIHKKNHKPPEFECHFCGKKVFRKVILKKHLLTQHIKHTTPEFTCSICDKEFYTKYSLVAHQNVHQEPKFSCRFCYAKFKQSSALKTHEKIHTGEKKFNCNQCSTTFTTKWALKCHSTVHKNTKTFQCEKCFKNFARKSYLTAHEKTHKGSSYETPTPKDSVEFMTEEEITHETFNNLVPEEHDDNFYFNLT